MSFSLRRKPISRLFNRTIRPNFLSLVFAAALLLSLTGFASAIAQDKNVSLSLGSAAPDFYLQDVVSGKVFSKVNFSGRKALLVVFLCRHCPYVQHVKAALAQMGKDYEGRDVGIVAISSNDANAYPIDSPEGLKEMAAREGFNFPILYDETQSAAQAYGAVCTPEFFLFDEERKLVYHGQFDDTRPGGRDLATGQDVRNAVDAVLSDQPVPSGQKPAQGCSIKWKKENVSAS